MGENRIDRRQKTNTTKNDERNADTQCTDPRAAHQDDEQEHLPTTKFGIRVGMGEREEKREGNAQEEQERGMGLGVEG